jgi:hypothetical protein
MSAVRRFFVFVAWLSVSSVASGTDLSQIPRAIAREPAYRTKPHYCLVVFGPEAKTRVWLVQDGDILYVDHDGDGDLTKPGNKVHAENRDEGSDDGVHTFKIGEIHDGRRIHKELSLYIRNIDHLRQLNDAVKAFLARNPHGRGYRLSAEIDMPGWKGATPGGRILQYTSYTDTSHVFQFGDRPQNAPIVHFAGPWQITLFGGHRLTLGRQCDVVLGVGTPGLGPATTTYIDYEGVIPENAYPTLDITYPATTPGKTSPTEHYTLKRRC